MNPLGFRFRGYSSSYKAILVLFSERLLARFILIHPTKPIKGAVENYSNLLYTVPDSRLTLDFFLYFFLKNPESSFSCTWAGSVCLFTEGLAYACVPTHNKQ